MAVVGVNGVRVRRSVMRLILVCASAGVSPDLCIGVSGVEVGGRRVRWLVFLLAEVLVPVDAVRDLHGGFDRGGLFCLRRLRELCVAEGLCLC